jgi:hypothetical protein
MALTAWNQQLGTEQGRLAPVGYTPTQGSYAFALGNDVAGRCVRIQAGDFVEVEQTADLGGSTLLRFNGRMRAPLQLPQVVLVNSAAPAVYRVTINGTDYDYTAGASDSVVSIAAGLVALINADTALAVSATLTGAADQFQLLLDDPEDAAFTLAVTGDMSIGTFTWRAKLLIDGSEFFDQELRASRQRDRVDGGAMVRNIAELGGTSTVSFRLQLVGSLAGSVVETEMPAFYVDNVTLDIYDDDPITGFVSSVVDWWRADDALDSGGALTVWPAKLGSENIIVDTGEAPAPLVVQLGGSNGRDYVDFDGTQAAHVVDVAALDLASMPVTLAAILSDQVESGEDGIAYKGRLDLIGSGNYGFGRGVGDNFNTYYDVNTGVRVSGSVDWTGAESLEVASIGITVLEATRTQWRVNGVEEISGAQVNAIAQDNEPLHVGALYSGAFGAGAYQNFLIARLYDLFIMSAEPSLFEKLRLEGYRQSRYVRA